MAPVDPNRVDELLARTGIPLDVAEADWYSTVKPVRSAILEHLRRLPDRYRAAELDALDAAQRPDVLRSWLADPESFTLWVAGDIGTGKTFAVAALLTEWAVRRAAENPDAGNATTWWSVAALLDAMRRDPDDAAWRAVKNAEILVLDDFAHVRPTEWAIERMWMLADHRVSRGLRQVCTTNARVSTLRDVWGAGVIDRLSENRWSLAITGDTRRRPAAAFTSTTGDVK
jgi:DNA replication protein DnaC